LGILDGGDLYRTSVLCATDDAIRKISGYFLAFFINQDLDAVFNHFNVKNDVEDLTAPIAVAPPGAFR